MPLSETRRGRAHARRACRRRAWTSALAVTVLAGASVGSATTLAAACEDAGARPAAALVTVRLADDGEVLDADRRLVVDGQPCAPAAGDVDLPVAPAVLHHAQTGASLEATELADQDGPVTTTVSVRDTTATTMTVPVDGPQGREDRDVRLGVPQLVTITVAYPASWEVAAPAGTGVAMRASDAGVEVSHTDLLFPPLTATAVGLQVEARPGRGTPDVRVEAVPLSEDAEVDLSDDLLDRDSAAVLGALSSLTGDGAEQLADGAGELADGSAELADGAGELAGGLGELAAGAGALGAGLQELGAGSRELAGGGAELADGAAQLAAGLPQLAEGAQAVAAGSQELADQLGTAADGAGALADGGDDLAAGARELAAGTAELAATAGEIRDAVAAGISEALDRPLPPEVTEELPPEALDAFEQARAAAGDVVAFVDEAAAGFQQLADGAAAVAEGAEQLAAGNRELAGGIDAAADGTQELADGAGAVAGGVGEVATGAEQLAAGSAGLADGLAAFAAGSQELGDAGSQLADGAAGAAAGAGELAGGASQLADGIAAFADGAAELPEAVREIVDTADRAGQRSAATDAVLREGRARAERLTGDDADAISYVLAHAGQRPVSPAVWAALAGGLLAVGAASWWWRRRQADPAATTEVPA